MAGLKISELPPGGAPQPTDLIPIARGSSNYSLLASNVALTVDNLNALVATLPTTLPASPGIVWNNGGLLCVS